MSDLTNAIVSQRIEVASGLIVLRVKPDGWKLPAWKSGQFGILGLPVSAQRIPLSDPEETELKPEKLIKRAYSISSSSEEKDYLEFFITLVHSGALTPRLFHLQPGDRVFMGERISGMFTLDQIPKGKNLVFIGTGTGLAPYMSMLRGDLGCEKDRQIAVLLGARHSWDLGYHGELIAMQRFCPTFHFQPVISQPSEEIVEWSGQTGYVQGLWESAQFTDVWGGRPSPENTHIMLCGNPAMIEGMLEVLTSEGFLEHSRKSPGQVHVEKYW